MIVSAASRLGRGVCLGLLLLGAAPAAAQTGGAPIRLTPRPPAAATTPAPSPSSPGAPAADTPSDVAAPAAAPLPAQSGAPAVAPAGVQPPAPQAPAGFQVDTLQSVEADTVGALAPGERALALSMWAGTPRPIAERLLGLLPSAPASRALFDLQRRLLLSASLNPEGAAGETRIVVLRAEKLLQMGDLIGVNRLLQSIPQRDVDDRLARLKVDAAWLVDDVAGGCAEVRRNLARSRAEVWQRGQAFCLMLDGDKEKADLAARLLPEQGFAEDATFTMLMDALAGNERARLASLVQPRPLDLAMLRAAHRPIPADAASSRDLRLMAAIALSVNAEGPIRLAAGERIEAAGAWSPGDLQKLYASVEVAPEALANAVSAAEMDKGPWGRAILWQAVRQKDSAPARTPFIERALALAGSPQAYAQQARLYAADLAALEPRGELLGLAATLARALEAAGRADAAQRWIGMLEAEAPRLPDARRALDGLWLLNTLAQPSAGAWQQERFESWRRSLKGTEAETEPRIATALILIEASGQKVPPLLWRDLVTLTTRRPAALPPAGLLPALAAASDERRLAESVALAEIALGETALAEQPAMVLGFLVQRLRAVDFAEEARAFALEAAIAAGL